MSVEGSGNINRRARPARMGGGAHVHQTASSARNEKAESKHVKVPGESGSAVTGAKNAPALAAAGAIGGSKAVITQKAFQKIHDAALASGATERAMKILEDSGIKLGTVEGRKDAAKLFNEAAASVDKTVPKGTSEEMSAVIKLILRLMAMLFQNMDRMEDLNISKQMALDEAAAAEMRSKGTAGLIFACVCGGVGIAGGVGGGVMGLGAGVAKTDNISRMFQQFGQSTSSMSQGLSQIIGGAGQKVQADQDSTIKRHESASGQAAHRAQRQAKLVDAILQELKQIMRVMAQQAKAEVGMMQA